MVNPVKLFSVEYLSCAEWRWNYPLLWWLLWPPSFKAQWTACLMAMIRSIQSFIFSKHNVQWTYWPSTTPLICELKNYAKSFDICSNLEKSCYDLVILFICFDLQPYFKTNHVMLTCHHGYFCDERCEYVLFLLMH